MKPRNVFPIITMLMFALMVGCKKEEDAGVRPTVTSTDPINKATSTGISSKITATFSVAMDPSSITASRFTLQQGTTLISGTVESTGTTATFTGDLYPSSEPGTKHGLHSNCYNGRSQPDRQLPCKGLCLDVYHRRNSGYNFTPCVFYRPSK